MRTEPSSIHDAVSGGMAEQTQSRFFIYILAALFAIVAGLGFVGAVAVGKRALLAFVAAAVLFAFFPAFLERFKSFLIFFLILCIPLQMGYHVLYDPVTVETTPFEAGIRIDVIDVALLILYAHWLLTLAWTKGKGRVRIGHPLGTLLLLWIVSSLITSYFAARAFRYSMYEIFALMKGFFLYFYLVNNTATERDLRLIVYALFGATFSHGLYTVFQYATKLNYTLHGETQQYIGPEGFRSIGFFGSPDAAAALMTFILPVAVAYYLVIRDGISRSWVLFGTLVTLVGLLATKVRAAWLATMISFGTLVLVSYYRGRIGSATFTKAVAVALLVVLLATPFIYMRFETGTYGQDRIPLLATAVNMVKDHWILGVGNNNYFFNIDRYVPVGFRSRWEYTVHDEYLLRLAEEGLLGFLLYYALNLFVMIKLWKITRSSSPWLYAVSMGLFAAMMGSIAHRFFSFYFYVNLYDQFVVVLALSVLADRLYRKEMAGSSAPDLTSPQRTA